MPQNPSSCFMVPGPGILFFKGLMAVGSSELSLSFIRCLLLDKYQSLVAPTPPCSLCFFSLLFFCSFSPTHFLFHSHLLSCPPALPLLPLCSGVVSNLLFFIWAREREKGERVLRQGAAAQLQLKALIIVNASISPSSRQEVIKLACSLRCRGDGRGAGGRLMFYLCLSLLTRKRQKKLTGYWRDWDPG